MLQETMHPPKKEFIPGLVSQFQLTGFRYARMDHRDEVVDNEDAPILPSFQEGKCSKKPKGNVSFTPYNNTLLSYF